jgi:hypothetical protein
MPQPLDILIRDAAEAEAIGDVVDGAQEPRKAVGQRAVEIEDGEGVGHGDEATPLGFPHRFLGPSELVEFGGPERRLSLGEELV